MDHEHKFFVAGQWRTSQRAVQIRSPYDQTLVGCSYEASATDAEAAVDAAHRAFQETRRQPIFRRVELLEKIVAALKRDQEAIARLITLEVGKPIRLARAEAARAARTFTDALEESKRIRGEWLPLDLDPDNKDRSAIVRRFPVGPVLGITPFNFPVNLVAHKLAPALACGAPIILKPAPQAPLCTLRLASIVEEAGAIPGTLSALPCEVPVAESMVRDDRLKVLSFTGSAAVGWELKRKSGKKRVLLELGGNAAVIVHGDADLDHAAERCVYGSFAYAGQICISVQRIFVQRRVFDDFSGKLLERVSKIRIGDPMQEDTDLGPMISSAAAERTEKWVSQAVQDGARLLAGGERDGSFYAATVLAGVRPEMKVCSEEIFAPVVSLEPYDQLDDALAQANRSPYGLQAGVFTNDWRAIWESFEELEVGGVIVNDVPTYRGDTMPYGGTKDSGLGREGVRFAIQEMTEPRVLALNMPRGPHR